MHIPERIRVVWDGKREDVFDAGSGELVKYVERVVLTMVPGGMEARATYLVPMPYDPEGFQHIELSYAGPALELDIRSPLPAPAPEKASGDIDASERTTGFKMLPVEAPPNTPVLFVETTDAMYSIARLDDVQRLVRESTSIGMMLAYSEIDEYVVAHTFDTTVGRSIDEFINARMAVAKELVDSLTTKGWSDDESEETVGDEPAADD